MPPDDRPLDELVAVTKDLESWLQAVSVPHAFIGGFAVAFLGRVRATHDIDAVMDADLDDLDRFVREGKRFGFSLLFPDGIDFARHTFVLQMRHEGSGIQTNRSFAFTAFEHEAIDRAVLQEAFGARFPLIPPEHLVVFKIFAGRPKDIGDVDGVLDRHPDLQLETVRRWLRELDDASEVPRFVQRLQWVLDTRKENQPSERTAPDL
jgi:hypothetical protein